MIAYSKDPIRRINLFNISFNHPVLHLCRAGYSLILLDTFCHIFSLLWPLPPRPPVIPRFRPSWLVGLASSDLLRVILSRRLNLAGGAQATKIIFPRSPQHVRSPARTVDGRSRIYSRQYENFRDHRSQILPFALLGYPCEISAPVSLKFPTLIRPLFCYWEFGERQKIKQLVELKSLTLPVLCSYPDVSIMTHQTIVNPNSVVQSPFFLPSCPSLLLHSPPVIPVSISQRPQSPSQLEPPQTPFHHFIHHPVHTFQEVYVGSSIGKEDELRI